MTPTDALAAALRERIVDGRPAPLPGLGTLVRQHVSARVEERPDGSRTLLPPGETIALAEPDGTAEPIAAAFGVRQGLAPGEEDAALARVMDEIEGRLASAGEVRLHGVGLLRRTSDGVVLGVEASLLESVNRAYEGLTPIATRPAAPPEPAPPEPAPPEPAPPEPAPPEPAPPDADDDQETPADETGPDESIETAPPPDETADHEEPGGAEQTAADAEETDEADEPEAAPPDPIPDEWAGEEQDGNETAAAEVEEVGEATVDEPEAAPPPDDSADVSLLTALALPDLLPHPDEAAAPPDAEPDDVGSLAPVAPPEVFTGDQDPDADEAAPPADDEPEDVASETAPPDDVLEDDEPGDDEVEASAPDADEALAVPFGLPAGETLADVLPPTPPDADPSHVEDASADDAGLSDEDSPSGGAAASLPETAPVEDADEPGGAEEPAEDAWMSSTWAAPGSTPPPPTLGDASGPVFEDAEVIDDGSGAAPVPDETAPGEAAPPEPPSSVLPADPPSVAVPADDVSSPPSPRSRRVPVDRVGPPIEPTDAAAPPVEALRGGAAVSPDDLATPPGAGRTAAPEDGGRGFPWWIVAALVLLLVVVLAWWAIARSSSDRGGAAPTAQETTAAPSVVSANPPDSLRAPSTPEEALGPLPDAAPPGAGDPETPQSAEPEVAPARGQPPRVPGGAASATRRPSASGGAANLVPPPLSGLDAADRAALAGGALDLDDRDSWTFVVASLQDRADADAVRRPYREAGYKTAIVSGGGFHRVAVGQFRSRSQALRLRDRLPPQAPPDTWALSLQTL